LVCYGRFGARFFSHLHGASHTDPDLQKRIASATLVNPFADAIRPYVASDSSAILSSGAGTMQVRTPSKGCVAPSRATFGMMLIRIRGIRLTGGK
jgi:hypothetical protein